MVSEVQKDINEIEVNDPIIESGEGASFDEKQCVPGVICHPKDYFELINECKLCGRLC